MSHTSPRPTLRGHVAALAVVALVLLLPTMTGAGTSPASSGIFRLVYSCSLPYVGELGSGLNYGMQPGEAAHCLWSTMNTKAVGDKVDITFKNQSTGDEVLKTSFTLAENGSQVTLGTSGRITFKVQVSLATESTDCEGSPSTHWVFNFTVE